MTIEDDYLGITGSTFSEMRVIIEGVISIFEDDTVPLFRLCKQHGEQDALSAMNDIGSALYALRRHIKYLQAEQRKESEQLYTAHHSSAE